MKVREQHAKLRDELIPQVASLATMPIDLLPVPGMKPLIEDTIRRAVQSLQDVVARADVFLMSGVVVIRLYVNGRDWVLVNTTLSAVAGNLRPENRSVPTRWRGRAAEAYEQVVAGQVAAVAQLRVAASSIGYALHWLAMSILTFYVTLLALLLQTCAVVVGAFLAFTSVVGIPGALLALGTAIPAIAAEVGALMTTVVECYARARTFFQDMRAKALDMSTFPNGNWPNPDPARYNDATVRDGDPSDWTVTS
ncbi:MAG: hypothetical protein IRY85_11335 [Micromonosporaceae bacterium]|nr:hypothetical protein [Micromonosporaceae bacterium]